MCVWLAYFQFSSARESDPQSVSELRQAVSSREPYSVATASRNTQIHPQACRILHLPPLRQPQTRLRHIADAVISLIKVK